MKFTVYRGKNMNTILKSEFTIYTVKVNAVADCYLEYRRLGESHEQAEARCYKLAANMPIDSYMLREGIRQGEKRMRG
jgi:hypothetical protein